MGHSRTPTQNTAGDGFPADPIDGSACGYQAEGLASPGATLPRQIPTIAQPVSIIMQHLRA